jgi:nucleotide-binding universal stress UspA family protein
LPEKKLHDAPEGKPALHSSVRQDIQVPADDGRPTSLKANLIGRAQKRKVKVWRFSRKYAMSLPVSPNISLRNILFATDFSSCSEAALPYAIGLSRRYRGVLNIVTVVSAEICDNAQPPDPHYYRHSAVDKMEHLVTSEMFQGINHQELVEESEGDVPLVLTELMRRHQIDLVVLGTHGRGGVKKALLGSVSEEIVYSACCPVLTVGPYVSKKPIPELNLRKILCSTDLMPSAARILAYALWLADTEHAQVTLLHTIERPSNVPLGYPEVEREGAMKRLEQLVPVGTKPSAEMELIVEFGTPAEQILKVAERQDADLIVMGPHSTSHPRISAHFPWVIAHQVLCHAHCPVLTVQG